MTEDIIDIYNTGNYKLMTEEIDKREDFFANLRDTLDNRCTHEDDFDIFTDIVCLYDIEKSDQKEEELEKIKEEKLYLIKQFSNWLITDFGIMDIDIKDYDFTDSIDDFLDSELTGGKY